MGASLCKRVDDIDDTTLKPPPPVLVPKAPVEDKPSHKELCTLTIQAGVRTYVTRKALEKRLRKRVKRKHAELEVVTCEGTYIDNLKTLRDQYKVPMVAHFKKKRWPEDDLNKIFSNLEAIITMHEVHFHPEFKRAHADGKSLATVFTTYGKFFGIYDLYLKNYNAACDLLQKYRTKHKSFRALLEEQRHDEGGARRFQAIESYLIMPCQRISRYELLLAEILRNSFESDNPQRYAELVKAHAMVKERATRNEAVQRDAEDGLRQSELSQLIKGLPFNLVDQNRRIILEGKAEILNESAATVTSASSDLHSLTSGFLTSTKGRKYIKGSVYVFSDLILWTSHKNAYLGSGSLSGATVCEEKEDDFLCVALKEVQLPKRRRKKINKGGFLWLRLASKRERGSWAEKIDKTITALAETEKNRKLRNIR